MLKISFNFDEESKSITNVKVVNVCFKYDNISIPIIEVEDNKLILSPKTVKLLSAKYGDRITIHYLGKNNEPVFPVISKSENLISPYIGTKLTKNNTVSFKGEQNTILIKYGKLFRLEECNPGVFKMIAITEDELLHFTQQ